MLIFFSIVEKVLDMIKLKIAGKFLNPHMCVFIFSASFNSSELLSIVLSQQVTIVIIQS